MIEAFKQGIVTGLKHWKLALLVYVLQLLLAGTVGLQVYHVLEASIGNSLEVNKLMNGYDNTVFQDLLNVHGASISPLVGQLRWILLTYAIFSIFINGGMLVSLAKSETSLATFWSGGAGYFFSFLKIAIIILLIAAVWTAIIWIPFLQFFPTSPEVFASEKTSVMLLLQLAGVWLVGIIFFFIWSVIARLSVIREKSGIRQALGGGFRWVLRHFLTVMGLFLLFALMQVLLAVGYLWPESERGMVTPALVWVFVGVQQVFVFARLLSRLMLYAGFEEFYAGKTSR